MCGIYSEKSNWRIYGSYSKSGQEFQLLTPLRKLNPEKKNSEENVWLKLTHQEFLFCKIRFIKYKNTDLTQEENINR